MKENKEKKIIFNEKIDDAIDGYSLAITFIIIGIFLLNNLDYFGNQVYAIVVLAIFTFIGIIGIFIELGKNNSIKGVDDIGAGLVLFIIWLVEYIYLKNNIINSIGLIFLMFSCYGIVKGIIKLLVSIFYNDKAKSETKKNIKLEIVKIFPAIASFILVIFNIVKIIIEIKNLINI